MVYVLNCVIAWFRLENKKPYIIHVGGTGVVGLWAYIEAFQELIEQVGLLSSAGYRSAAWAGFVQLKLNRIIK